MTQDDKAKKTIYNHCADVVHCDCGRLYIVNNVYSFYARKDCKKCKGYGDIFIDKICNIDLEETGEE